jgi:hypothetical protein
VQHRALAESIDALEALGVSPGATAGLGRLKSALSELDYGSPVPPMFTPVKSSNRPPLSKTRLMARGLVAGLAFIEEKRLRAAGKPAGPASKAAAKATLVGLAPHVRRQCTDDGEVTWQMPGVRCTER